MHIGVFSAFRNTHAHAVTRINHRKRARGDVRWNLRVIVKVASVYVRVGVCTRNNPARSRSVRTYVRMAWIYLARKLPLFSGERVFRELPLSHRAGSVCAQSPCSSGRVDRKVFSEVAWISSFYRRSWQQQRRQGGGGDTFADDCVPSVVIARRTISQRGEGSSSCLAAESANSWFNAARLSRALSSQTVTLKLIYFAAKDGESLKKVAWIANFGGSRDVLVEFLVLAFEIFIVPSRSWKPTAVTVVRSAWNSTNSTVLIDLFRCPASTSIKRFPSDGQFVATRT